MGIEFCQIFFPTSVEVIVWFFLLSSTNVSNYIRRHPSFEKLIITYGIHFITVCVLLICY